MADYRNPHAALRVGQIISEHLTKSQMSVRDFADRLGASEAKVVYFLTGRHYIRVEYAKRIAETLSIARSEFFYAVLQQCFPKISVNNIWEAFAQWESGDEGSRERCKKQKREKKRKKLVRTAAS